MLAAGADAAADPTRLRRMEPARLTFWAAYAAALARVGEHARADQTLVPYERRAATCGRRSAMAAASRARGVLHAARHQEEDALAAFDTSLAHLDGLGMPFEAAMTRLERAGFCAGPASAAPPPATSARPACCSPAWAPSRSWPAATRNSAPACRKATATATTGRR